MKHHIFIILLALCTLHLAAQDNVMEGDLLPESLEEKVICYADKFFSKSRINEAPKTLERARKSLAKFGGATLERFDALVDLFGDPADL